MKLYDYIYKESKRGGKSLILIIDLNEFNNVSIHIDDEEEIDNFMYHLLHYPKYMEKYLLEELYHNEIDPYKRGEN
tara:strand:- start:641 stop:868 length:228 start_codon:yes stop_codon:yes gene_type:complete